MKNKKTFANFILAIGEMFDKDISQALRDIYWKALEPFSDAQCAKAFNAIILSSRFFPKPVDVIEAIRGTGETRAITAWGQVLKAIQAQGAYQSVKFSDPVIHSVVEFMEGWPKLCGTLTDELKWKQKEFERLYKTMEGRGEHAEYLPGIMEIDNGAQGYETEGPVLIGFERKQIETKEAVG